MSFKLRNILVRMPNWIGDVVMATPILQDLKEAFPEASITAMIKRPLDSLIKYDPHLDEIFTFDKPKWNFRHDERRDIIRKIQAGKYDAGILLTNSFSSAYLFFRGSIPLRIGYSMHGRRFLLTKTLPREENLHQVESYKRLLEPLGVNISSHLPKLYLHPEEKKEANDLLESLHIPKGAYLVGVNPGAAYGSAKCWPQERFCELAKKLLEKKNHYVIFFGDQTATSMVGNMVQDLGPKAINLAGKTHLRLLMALLERVSVLVTNDSGPMHIADALKTPLVALFGSTSADKTGPSSGIVLWNRTECSPCFKRECPIDFRCMRGISVDAVLMAVESLLDKQRG